MSGGEYGDASRHARAPGGEQRKDSTNSRMVKLAELWERTSSRGTHYFSGFIGDIQVLLFDAGKRDHPTRPGEKVHVWRLMAQERDPSRRSRS